MAKSPPWQWLYDHPDLAKQIEESYMSDMSEAVWLTSTDPAAMLAFLGSRISERKRRLALVASFRSRESADQEQWNWFDTNLNWNDGSSITDTPILPEVLREIIGNPFKPVTLCGPVEGITKTEPVPGCPNCAAILRWNDSTPLRLAERAYEERDWSLLTVLADALEEASCIETDILEHLRKPGGHARGCWALDLILGKE